MDEGEEGLEGNRIGHYLLGKTIGRGGFAVVKEGRHDVTGLAVAVKIINKAKMKNKNMISKVKREIKILKFINHPNIIKLYEVLDTTKDIFVVMELAKGGELFEEILNHRSNEEELKCYFRQIMEGVEFAHLNLVAHRDLKPENVLLDKNKRVKIADFGLSNVMRDGKLLRTNCGSLNYAAPEIIGKRYYEGTSVDVWSCGVILYTMLSGCLPFDEEIVSILYKKIERAEFVIPDYVSPAARNLIERMLRVNPYERIRVSQIKLHPWLRKDIPIYARLSFFSVSLQESVFRVDDEILEKVKGYNMDSLKNINDIERITKIIKLRMDDSFVTAYELLKDEQDRNTRNSVRPHREEVPIFQPILNKLEETTAIKVKKQEHRYKFGRQFHKSSKIVIGVIFDIFEEQGIDYEIKDIHYCVSCIYYPPMTAGRKRSSTEMAEDKIFGYQDEQRFVKNQIKFTLQLYTTDNAGSVVVDLRLTQGHPLVFLSFSKEFYCHINKVIEE